MDINSASLFSMFVYGDHAVGEPGPYGSTIIRQQKDGDFYALAFYLPDTNEVVVSYRGTDDQDGEYGDKLTGWPIGVGLYGLPETQADKAFAFYNDVLADIADPFHPAHVASTATISFTGHSLGGGLAGLVSSFAGKPAFVFDSMPFIDAANNLHADVTGLNPPGVPIISDAIRAYWSALAFPDGQPHEPSFSLVQAASMAGEALSGLRYGQSVPVPGGFVISSGHDAQTIVQNELYGGTLTDSGELHSMGLLAIALHGGLQHSEDEKAGGNAFYKYLFDATFASGLGFATPTALQDALAYSLNEGTSALDSFFSDMAIIGNMLRTGPGPYADALARMSIKHAVHVATEDGNLRTGLIEVRDGYANIALTGVHDPDAMVLDLLLYGNDAFSGAMFDVPPNGYANIAVELSGYGGEVHLGPGGTLYFGSLYNDDIYGSSSDDVIVSLGTDDMFFDVVRGGGGNDLIYASAGNDLVYGGAGNDTLNGGAGHDKAHYSGNMADYGIAIVGDKVRLTDAIANRDGVDTLIGIEELVFADGSIMTANLPKAPTSFQVWQVNAHTHTGMVSGSQSYAAALTNIVDVDSGSNLMEIDASQTDAAILPYLTITGNKLTFNGIAPIGTFDIGLRTYDAANNVRSETQVVALEIQENTAPIGVSWDTGRPGNGGTILEGAGTNTVVGYIRVSDENGQRDGGSGENYSIRLLGDYANTYRLTDDGDIIPGAHEHYHKVIVVDPNNVDYEYDATPALELEITDVAGNVRTFTLEVNVQDVANTNWKETNPGTAGQIRNRGGYSQDDTMDASVSLGTYNLTGGAGGDTLIGGRGDDKLDGGVGNDILRGNAGVDQLYALSGSDTVYGGIGHDTVHLTSSMMPEYVGHASFENGFLVLESGDTTVRIYSDVETIHISTYYLGDFFYTQSQYMSQFLAA
jgi:Ca2+-binding RTX toxin-like protein